MATDHFSALSKQRYDRGASGVALALAAILAFAASGAEPDEPRQTETRKDKCRKQSAIQS
jgi:hypothetical protein